MAGVAKAFQKTQAPAVFKHSNGTTESRAAARELRGMLHRMNQDEREDYLRERHEAGLALDEIEDVDCWSTEIKCPFSDLSS